MIIIEVCLPVAIVVISSASEIGQLKSRLDKSAYIEDDFFDQIINQQLHDNLKKALASLRVLNGRRASNTN